MRPELKAQISIPFVLTCIFVLSSFVPVIQILILTLNGGYLASIQELISSKRGDTGVVNIIGNLPPILLLLFWYYKETNRAAKIVAASLAMTFMTAFLLFMTMDDNVEHDPYWLQFIIVALISGSILIFIAYWKYRQTTKKNSTVNVEASTQQQL